MDTNPDNTAMAEWASLFTQLPDSVAIEIASTIRRRSHAQGRAEPPRAEFATRARRWLLEVRTAALQQALSKLSFGGGGSQPRAGRRRAA